MRLRKSNAQSTLEYIVVLTVIVAALIAAAVTLKGDSTGSKGLGKLMKQAGESIKGATQGLKNNL